ncbi:MAG: hypothetical protein ACK5M7_13010 [Draconibacterium sp.]
MKSNKINKALDKKMTRKEAIKKTGITALTAATLIFLDTKASAQNSGTSPGSPPPGW